MSSLPTTSTTDLSILIVNFNGASFIKRCFDSIFNSDLDIQFNVLVLDNGSSDNSIELLNDYSDRIQLIISNENVGFPSGVNQLLPLATGRYVFLLNIDAFVSPDAIQSLYTVISNDDSIGVIGPKLLHPDGRLQPQGNQWSGWWYRGESPRSIRFLSGAAMMLKTSFFRDQLGGFDSSFFFYNDDIDICIRIRNHDKTVLYYPLVEVIHVIGGVSKTVKVKILAEGYRGGFWIVKKHYGYLVYLIYRVIMIVGFTLKALIHALLSGSTYHRNHLTVCLIVLKYALTGDIRNRFNPSSTTEG